MKIKQIDFINNFGQYKSFKWQNEKIEYFKKYNIFYGWNYSGKTTLSRIFRSIELKKGYPDYQDAHFSLITDNGDNITEKNIINVLTRVFNEEFIEDNFEWNNENDNIEPVLILGKESKELEKELQEKQEQKDKFENEKYAKAEEKRRLERDLDNLIQSKATEIRNILSITNPRDFDKNKLIEKIKDVKNNYQEKIISNEEIESTKSFINSPKLDTIPLPHPLSDDHLKKYQNEVKEILTKTVSAQKIIENSDKILN